MGFYASIYPTWVFQIWRDLLHRLLSYCWETARRSIRPIFSVHPVGKTMRWIKKWMSPFLMGTTSSITVQRLGKIALRAPTVGAKTWCLYGFFFVFIVRIAAKRQTVGIKFTHRPKIRLFPGDSLHRFMSNFAGPTGTWVRLDVQNFTSIATGGGNAAPKMSNISTFW